MKAMSLKKSSRYLLIIGVLLALAGLVIATVNQSDFGKSRSNNSASFPTRETSSRR